MQYGAAGHCPLPALLVFSVQRHHHQNTQRIFLPSTFHSTFQSKVNDLTLNKQLPTLSTRSGLGAKRCIRRIEGRKDFLSPQPPESLFALQLPPAPFISKGPWYKNTAGKGLCDTYGKENLIHQISGNSWILCRKWKRNELSMTTAWA